MSKVYDCLVIHKGTLGSNLGSFTRRCMFKQMSPDVSYVYVDDIDTVLKVTKVVACGSRKNVGILPEYMIFVEDRDFESASEYVKEDDSNKEK